jgi:PAS domain S-box-containing protein
MATKNHKKSSPASKPKTTEQRASEPILPQDEDLTIVGIGASAGGLKALQAFFEALPAETGLAFVVITHLHPEYESHLAEILQHKTQMSVQQVNGLVKVEPDHVYIIPPNRNILMADQKLDITDVKETERTRENYESFYTLFHSNPIPTMLTRLEDKVIINVNQAFSDSLGLKPEEMIGRSALDFNLISEEVEKSLKEGNIRNYEQEITLPSGQKRTMLSSTQRMTIENAEVILSTFIDITERIAAERQSHKLNAERAAAELKERRRIAQLLHDDLQQRIFAIKMHLERLEDGFARNDAESVKEDFAKLEAWLAEAIAMTRKLSFDISPLSGSGSTLPEVILWLAAEMKEQYGLQTTFEANGVKSTMSADLLAVLLQTIRELLFNVVKHGGIDKATIQLRKRNHELQIIVSDSGKGFDPETLKNQSSGLTNIRQQLNLFGCTLEFNSAPGTGTRVTIGVPPRKAESTV